MQIDYEVGIVGAGLGGIIAALKLANEGKKSFVIFERANEAGGVWRDNIYPGCACDIPSSLYTIKSELYWDWSSSFAKQPEILQYLNNIVHKNNLDSHIHYNTCIKEIVFIEELGGWKICDDLGNTYRVRMVILATGPLNRPKVPDFDGLETYSGKSFHSSAWNYAYNLAGKKVAVIGTGASAIQIVPNIAARVAELLVFQRTPAWILPRGDRKISRTKRRLHRYLPFTRTLNREITYLLFEAVGSSFFGNVGLRRILTYIALRKLKREVYDPQLREMLTPKYQLGCKRILISDDFYPTFNRPNVNLVTHNIHDFVSDGIRTKDGQIHQVDVIVFATGFVVADLDNYIKIVGEKGKILTEEWELSGGEAYKGINCHGYPNLSFLLGPNSGLSHSSAIHVIESQMDYIIKYLKNIEYHGERCYLDVRSEIQSMYNAKLQLNLKNTVWASGCHSWYLNKNGKNTTIYPGLTRQYRRETGVFNIGDFNVSKGC